MQRNLITTTGMCGLALLLSGCMSGSGDVVTRSPFSMFGGTDDPTPALGIPALDARMADGTTSPIIDGLLGRQSVLPDGGPYAQVADAVLAANARVAEADLRAARLRSEARNSNWLPTIGPAVSLTSLGDLVAGLVVDQVLFDNGRKKAERDYAKADVEVAAVALAADTNDRVLAALDLYLVAEAARARADISRAAMPEIDRLEHVMSERVRGGVSGLADLQVVAQKRSQMQSDLRGDTDAAVGAMAELAAMSALPLDGVTGLSTLSTELVAETLTVLKARAEATRALAEVQAARSGYLPGLGASARTGTNGESAGLTVAAPSGFGPGSGAALEALSVQQASADARVGQVQEDANRTLAALQAQLVTAQRAADDAVALAAQAAQTYDLFAAQQKAGQRGVPDVVGALETRLRTARQAVTLRHDAARVELKIAALKGVLVDGEAI